MKKQKLMSAVISLCMLICMLLLPVQSVHATTTTTTTTNPAILEARKGVLQVEQVVAVDGEVIGGVRGTGFLIGTDDAAQIVITNHHVVNAYPHEKKQLRALVEADGIQLASDSVVETYIRIAIKRDVYIKAQIVNQSEVGDFAILKMEQPIYDRAPLKIADSSKVVVTQKVYALGFPSAVEQAGQIDVVHTADDVTVTTGMVSKVADNIATGASISTIFHDAQLSGGNSGGPLVTEQGYVVGVNTYLTQDGNAATTYYYSTEFNEVRDVLDALGYDYTLVDGNVPTPTPETSVTPTPETSVTPTPEADDDLDGLFDDLETQIKKTETIDLERYTEESVKNLEAALDDAKDVWNDTSSSEDELEEAMEELERAKDGLVEKPSGISPIIIIAAAAIAVIIIVVIVIVVVVSSGNKKKKAEVHRPVPPIGPRVPTPPVPPVGGGQWNPQRPPMPPMGDDGSAETGVLNDGSTETTVLGGQNIPNAYLIRRKNNERIVISKAVFKLGKERRKVDYCISDNTNVSRTHADIVYRNGEFYIVDNNATNGTNVNGVSVPAGHDKKIVNNDIIKLADEEFQFRTM